MNPTEKPASFIPSASEYILDNFEPTDRIAMLVLNRDFGETIQRITSAQKAASPEFQAWLRYKNANGSDIYIGMNPLKKDASTRTKEEIESIKHVYLDLDHGGSEALEAIENSSVVPKPNYVLNSSPEKHQVVWKVEGMNLEEAEGLLARHGTRIRWRSRRHRCDSRLAVSRFRQQEIRNKLLCRGSQRIHGNLPSPRFQTAHRLTGLAAPQLRQPRQTRVLAADQSKPVRTRLGFRQARTRPRRRSRRSHSSDCTTSRHRQNESGILRPSHGRKGVGRTRHFRQLNPDRILRKTATKIESLGISSH